MNNEKINKFLCEIYPADDKGDISAGTIVYFTGLWLIIAVIVLAVFGAILTLLGCAAQLCGTTGLWIPEDEITLMTPVYGFVFGVAMVLIVIVIDLLARVKIAHCPVKEKDEVKENEHGESDTKNKLDVK